MNARGRTIVVVFAPNIGVTKSDVKTLNGGVKHMVQKIWRFFTTKSPFTSKQLKTSRSVDHQ